MLRSAGIAKSAALALAFAGLVTPQTLSLSDRRLRYALCWQATEQ